MDFNQWINRIASRSDLTGRLTHLTKPDSSIDLSGKSIQDFNVFAVDNLIKILSEEIIVGSGKSGFIVGEERAVCFQDIPLYGLIQNVKHEEQRRFENPKEKLRYCGVGLSFVKPELYSKHNARPVIYEQTNKAKDFLLKDEWWRIVSLDHAQIGDLMYKIIDWTHEREWRVKGDLKFNVGDDRVHIILYDPECVTYFLNKCPKEIINELSGITTLTSILM